MGRTLTVAATLSDVAARVGLHRTTVSLALRDHPRIPLPTRLRVQAAARAMDYRMNPLIAALMRSRRTRARTEPVTLVYLAADVDERGADGEAAAHRESFAGALAQAKRRGYRLERWIAGAGEGSGEELGRRLLDRAVAGVVLGALPAGWPAPDFGAARVACVALGLATADLQFHRIVEDLADAVTQALARCRARGYRRVGLVCSADGSRAPWAERVLGAYARRDLPTPAADRLPPFGGAVAEGEAFPHWLEEQRPEVLLATDAAAVAQRLAVLGWSAPDDVALVDLHATLGGTGAGVCFAPAWLGALAVEKLISLLHRNETGPAAGVREETLVAGNWREGPTLLASAPQPRCVACAG